MAFADTTSDPLALLESLAGPSGGRVGLPRTGGPRFSSLMNTMAPPVLILELCVPTLRARDGKNGREKQAAKAFRVGGEAIVGERGGKLLQLVQASHILVRLGRRGKEQKKNTTLKKGKHEQAVGKAGQAGAKKMCAGETWSWGWWLDVMSSKKRGLTARSALLSLGADRWNRMICADGGDAPAMEKA